MLSEILNAPFLISMLLALSWHEAAHAFAANALGDPTAKDEGRMTLNPIAHLDPVGTLMFFLVQFGWGKPVPVNPRYFRRIRRDTALVSLAGPASNLLLAIIAFVLLLLLAPGILQVSGTQELLFSPGVGGRISAFLVQVCATSLFLNLGLMAFNLLPIAPLDGSKILQAFVPYQFEEAYERFMRNGPFILIALLIVERALNVPILLTWISVIMDGVLKILTMVAGG